jgi:hypothetical protein
MTPSTPKASRNFDLPIGGADQDLLGASKYARELANYILRVPGTFTIGIYGQWGAGKSSFVRLVEQELGDRVAFINFGAWEYKTADELWRALIQHIAKTLYGQCSATDTPQPPLPERVRRFLDRNVVDPEASETEVLASYDDVMEALDATGPASIRKSRSGNLPIDENEALLSLGQAVAASLAAVSPLGGIVRSWLGGEEGRRATKLLKKDNDDEARKRIDSIQRYKDILAEILRRIRLKDGRKRVCVFVDDLDRCMPDVAVDLLDAIRVFLGEADCVFIVAADRELVGQGLKLRFKDLVQAAKSESEAEFYTRKGDQYIEKIVQFGVPVPQPTRDEAHRFISARFPGWVACSDLINTALEGNPRRMHQYAALLEYRYAVAQMLPNPGPGGSISADWPVVCDKVTALFWSDQETADHIRELLRVPGPFQQLMGALESSIRSQNSSWLSSKPEVRELWRRVQQLQAIGELLIEPPLFSEVNPGLLETLMEFGDLQPEHVRLFRTRDGVFQRIALTLFDVGAISSESLLMEDLERLRGLRKTEKWLVDGLLDLAHQPDYAAQVSAIEARLEDPSLIEPKLREHAEKLLHVCTDPALPQEDREKRRNLFRGKVSFSAIPRELILLFGSAGESFSSGQSITIADLRALRRDFSDTTGRALQALEVRIQIARRHLARRRFAKVDVLIHCWPDLARYLNYEREVLPTLEAQLVSGPPDVIEERFRRWAGDERFLRFLRLQPSLKNLYSEIRKVAAVTPTPAAQVPSSATTAEIPVQPPAPPAPEPPRKREGDGEILQLRLAPTKDGISNSFSATLSGASVLIQESIIQLNVAELLQRASLYDVEKEYEQVKRMLAAIGGELYRGVFPERLKELLRGRGPQLRRRLLLDLMPDAVGLSSIPWEAVYDPDALSFPVLDGSLSVIRYIRVESTPILPDRSGPLKLLAILPNPTDTGLVVEEATQILTEQLNAFPVRLQVLSDRLTGPTTLATVLSAIRTMRPDLFFFFGHASVDTDAREGLILLSKEDGTSTSVGISSLDTAIHDAGVSFAVLMGAETGSSRKVGLQNSFAGRLVFRGVPAAIASVRAITKQSALIFTASFLPRLLRTGDIEAALADARIALSDKGEDWSAYVLFSCINRIESLQLLAPPAA